MPDLSTLAAKMLHAPAGRIHLGNAALAAIQLDEQKVSSGMLLFCVPVHLM